MHSEEDAKVKSLYRGLKLLDYFDSTHTEIFVVDLPDDMFAAGEGPLEGTETAAAAPRHNPEADHPYRR